MCSGLDQLAKFLSLLLWLGWVLLKAFSFQDAISTFPGPQECFKGRSEDDLRLLSCSQPSLDGHVPGRL